MIDIIDIGFGNIRSLTNILTQLQVPSRTVSCPNKINSDTIILPGVGSAGPYMKKLKESDLDQAIKEHHSKGKRIIGICLGLQLLTLHSEEDGGTECLGIIDAHTQKMEPSKAAFYSHTGWERFDITSEFFAKSGCPGKMRLTRKRTLKGRVFYNHVYGVCHNENASSDQRKILNNAYSAYSSIIAQKNIIGIQFHPEKSQVTGLKLFEMML